MIEIDEEMALTGNGEIGRALSLYDNALFWEYSEREVPGLGPELVVPRVTRYGSLEEVIRLFVIYPVDKINEVVVNDKELDSKEETLLNYFCIHGERLNGYVGLTKMFDYGDPYVKPAIITEGIRMANLLDVGLMKLDIQNRRNTWTDLIDLNTITEIHPLSELLSAYNHRYPPFPIKQCYGSLISNLTTPPSIDSFPHDLMHDGVKPEHVISVLKDKCLDVYRSYFKRQEEVIQGKDSTKGNNNLISN